MHNGITHLWKAWGSLFLRSKSTPHSCTFILERDSLGLHVGQVGHVYWISKDPVTWNVSVRIYWMLLGADILIRLTWPFLRDTGCWIGLCGDRNCVIRDLFSVIWVISWSYESYLPSRTWLRPWIVKDNISLMFFSWIGHSVLRIVAH